MWGRMPDISDMPDSSMLASAPHCCTASPYPSPPPYPCPYPSFIYHDSFAQVSPPASSSSRPSCPPPKTPHRTLQALLQRLQRAHPHLPALGLVVQGREKKGHSKSENGTARERERERYSQESFQKEWPLRCMQHPRCAVLQFVLLLSPATRDAASTASHT
jgi:hypothetical protein